MRRAGVRGIKIPDGVSVDKKFAYVERMLQRMSRRLHHDVGVLITPALIHGYVAEPDNDGFLLQGVLFGGKLLKIAVGVGIFHTKKRVRFVCELSDKEFSQRFEFSTRLNSFSMEINLDIAPGSMIKLSLFDDREEHKEDIDGPVIEHFCYSGLLQLEKNPARIEQVAVEQIEATLDSLEATDEGV